MNTFSTNDELQYKKDLEYIKNFRLIDDDFMKKVFTDKTCVQLVLRIIMDKSDLTVTDVQSEYVVHNLYGRSVRLDVHAVDSTGKEYDIEIQRSDKGAGAKRARYNSSMMDVDAIKAGDSFDNLPETYVIFITENDVLKRNMPIYHIDRIIRETGELFEDDTHIIYVNNEIRNNTPLGLLMSDFVCTDAKNIHYRELADRVKYFKEDEEGVNSMCRAMEEMRAEAAAKAAAIAKAEGEAKGRAEGEAKGRAKGINAVIEAMKAAGMDTSQVEKLDIK